MASNESSKSLKLAPGRVARALAGTASTIELLVEVSDKNGIKGYGFAFVGVPVPMKSGKGVFHAPAGKKKLLEWVMVGEPNGYMKVTVTRGGAVVKERAKSTIPAPEREGYDAFEIEVA